MKNDNNKVMQLATEAGHILLENGAEISRVEDTMKRIATAYGVEEKSFFVLSNGIIATGQEYAKAEFIPIKGTQLSRVADVNQLSRDVTAGKCDLDTLDKRLKEIKHSQAKPWWEQILGIAAGVSSFCILFGGSFYDAVATFIAGLFLGLFMTFTGTHLPRIFSNLLGGTVGGMLCIVAFRIIGATTDITVHLPNMIIGTIIALVPGVPFTNGIRDLANEDYIAGATRLLDAFLAFLCIALGVAVAFIIDSVVTGGIMRLGTSVADGVTSAWYIQMVAAFIGTVGFSVLFGAPRRYYLSCGFVGMAGWAVYIFTGSIFFGALVVAAASRILAIIKCCPVTVFLICGIIPLVPGGGIFWTAYYIVSEQLRLAATTGFSAIKVTIAIAGGIIIMATILGRKMLRVRS